MIEFKNCDKEVEILCWLSTSDFFESLIITVVILWVSY